MYRRGCADVSVITRCEHCPIAIQPSVRPRRRRRLPRRHDDTSEGPPRLVHGIQSGMSEPMNLIPISDRRRNDHGDAMTRGSDREAFGVAAEPAAERDAGERQRSKTMVRNPMSPAQRCISAGRGPVSRRCRLLRACKRMREASDALIGLRAGDPGCQKMTSMESTARKEYGMSGVRTGRWNQPQAHTMFRRRER